MTTNPLQLRKCFDITKAQILSNLGDTELSKQFNLWKIILILILIIVKKNKLIKKDLAQS